MDTDVLFEPIRIGSVPVKNRVVMGPMALADSFPPGYASAQTRAVYAERAAGGVGMIIMGGTVGTRQAWQSAPFANVLRFDTEETLASLAEIPETVHRFDCRIFAQLMQGYGRGGSSRIRGVQSAAASPSQLVLKGGMGIPGFMDDYVGEMPRELKLDEIEVIEEEVGVAAARAQRAGFDGVELPCFIGYLAAGFLSPRLNRRTDRYGGSLENRARFIINNVRQVRERTGADFPVGVRLTADDHVKGGIRLEESLQVARWLVDEGVNYINVFEGGYEVMELTSSTRDGQMLDNGTPQAFTRELDVPVLCPGVHDPHNAARMIAAGQADMVSLTRALLADPRWADKTRLGRTADITRCDRSSECVSLLFKGLPVRCRNNAELGWERLRPATGPRVH